jgi:tRNA G10  N-methylase Trm11
MPHRYAFLLGREPNISTAEITAVLARLGLASKSNNHLLPYFLTTTETPLDASALMSELGGTIKILRQVPTAGALDQAIADFLEQTTPDGKLHFSLTGKKSERLAKTVKKNLKAQGRSVRYIAPNNSATVLHNNLLKRESDLAIIDNELYVTEALQPFEEFGERDYGRPSADSKSGMLPPKLARMLINLAELPHEAVLLDPFCGSGTILTEAVVMKYNHIIGSDISAQAIDAAGKNLAWIHRHQNIKTLKQENTEQTFVSSVQELPKKLKPGSVDAIVTEPYLGKPLHGRESKLQLEIQAGELGKLYVSAFASFAKILKPNGVVIFISPAFRYGKDEWLRVRWQKEAEQQGFKTITLSKTTPYLQYARPNQHVAREIWKFTRY